MPRDDSDALLDEFLDLAQDDGEAPEGAAALAEDLAEEGPEPEPPVSPDYDDVGAAVGEVWQAERPQPVDALQAQHDRAVERTNDVEAERAALGACFLDSDAAKAVMDTLSPSDFSDHRNAAVFEAVGRVWKPGRTPDVVIVRSELERAGALDRIGGSRYLVALVSDVPTTANAGFYARRVRRLAISREERTWALRLVRAATRKVAEGARATLAALHEEARRLDTGGDARTFVVTRGDELVAKQLEPLEWLVADNLVFRKGLTHLVAPQKVGKSLSALGLALALVRRGVFPGDDEQTFLGSEVIGAGPVVYLSGEGGEHMMQPRLRKMEPHLGDPLSDLHLLTEEPLPNLSVADDQDWLTAYCRNVGAVLLVIDPLSRFWKIDDENNAAEQTKFFTDLRRLAKGANVAVLTVHHDAKAGAETGMSGGRGSSVSANEVDTLVNMRPDPEEEKAALVQFQTRHGGGPGACKVRIDPDTLVPALVCRLGRRPGPSARGSGSDGAAGQSSDLDVLAALERCGRWVNYATWAEEARVSERTLRRRLKGLREAVGEGTIAEMRHSDSREKLFRFCPPEEKAAPGSRTEDGPSSAPESPGESIPDASEGAYDLFGR